MAGFDRRRVAVTGAAGFIGGAIAARLAAEGAQVVAIDLAAGEELAAAGLEPVTVDVTDRAGLERAVTGCELVVHAAALVREWGTMAEFIRVNVGGTAAAIAAAEAAGARLVQVSSVVVYGYDASSEQDESAFRRVCGIPYIDTKSASDRLAARRGAVVLRPGDVYGPGSIPWVVRPLELARAGRIAVPGDGSGVMLPCFIDDLVAAVLAAAQRGEPGGAYTAWEGVSVTFGEYFDRLCELAGRPPARRLPRPMLDALGAGLERWASLRGEAPMLTSHSALFLARRGTASIERARSELGWEPSVPLDQGLSRTAAWARAEGLVA